MSTTKQLLIEEEEIMSELYLAELDGRDTTELIEAWQANQVAQMQLATKQIKEAGCVEYHYNVN